ncbi:DNA-binding LacI/PurR family transcriptional regulator [Motilibacter peucedani]|uniref:DNA-binding LacI/PurR family transcriptional regulator n=1 Tax=Motilibacter peucedani TaxID=598650 RepID=A0A420XQR5_9ACTN|nr:LacI family DNA-binding transcriptional regulator [Motilibacter peucedani]RKS75651.1 DNA-binding LacI/PurR family transcriptional regulator [Motilibacter peucedani]
MERRPTSADVARESGVSRATVSFVINDSKPVSAQTRRRVLDAAERLGYAPHGAARSLRAGRSDLVLLYVPPLPVGAALARLIDDIAVGLGEHGLSLTTYLVPERGRHDLAALLRSVSLAAVIAIRPPDGPDGDALRHSRVPVVVVPKAGPGDEGSHDVLQQRVGRRQVEHLADRGHRRLGYAVPTHADVLSAFAVPRLEGVRSACRALGLPAPLVREVPLDVEGARLAVEEWTHEACTAVCAYNDDVAFAVLAGVHSLGVRVPEELAVVGVDDIPLAPLAMPPLTTVVVDGEGVARQIVHDVRQAIGDEPAVSDVEGEIVHLVVRAST